MGTFQMPAKLQRGQASLLNPEVRSSSRRWWRTYTQKMLLTDQAGDTAASQREGLLSRVRIF